MASVDTAPSRACRSCSYPATSAARAWRAAPFAGGPLCSKDVTPGSMDEGRWARAAGNLCAENPEPARNPSEEVRWKNVATVGKFRSPRWGREKSEVIELRIVHPSPSSILGSLSAPDNSLNDWQGRQAG